MSISDDINRIINESPAPPNMPPNIKEARDMAHWASVVFLVMAGLIAIGGILNLISGIIWIAYAGIISIISGIIYFFLAFLAFYAATEIKKKVIPMLDMGNIKGAKDESVKWLVVGLFTGFIPFILMILSYMKLDENPRPQPPYQQYPTQGQPYQQPPPASQQYQSAPPQGYQQAPGQPYQAPPQQNPPQPQPYQQPPPAPQQYQTAQQNQYQAPATPDQQPPSQNYQPPQAQSPAPSGVPLQVMRCPNCGAEVQSGMEACPNCGARLV